MIPSYAVSQLRAAGKVRWLLATYLAEYVAAVATEAAISLPPVAAWFVGSDAGALPQTLDVLPAVVCVPLTAQVGDAASSEAPHATVTSRTQWAVRAVVDADSHGPDTAAALALAYSLAAAQMLTERMPEPVDGAASGTWVWGARLVIDAPLPLYVDTSQHRVMHEAQVEISLRSRDAVTPTRYPGPAGVMPALSQLQSSAPALTIGGDVSATCQPGTVVTIAASAYIAGLTLSTGTGAALIIVAQTSPGYPATTVADAGTLAAGALPATVGTTWTVTGVDPSTGAILPYRITFT